MQFKVFHSQGEKKNANHPLIFYLYIDLTAVDYGVFRQRDPFSICKDN